MIAYLRLLLDAGSSLPKNLCARVLCRLMHQQLDALIRTPVLPFLKTFVLVFWVASCINNLMC
jgi:hypothetical protein